MRGLIVAEAARVRSLGLAKWAGGGPVMRSRVVAEAARVRSLGLTERAGGGPVMRARAVAEAAVRGAWGSPSGREVGP